MIRITATLLTGLLIIANLNLVFQPSLSHYVLGLNVPSYNLTINAGAVTLVTPLDSQIQDEIELTDMTDGDICSVYHNHNLHCELCPANCGK